MVHDVEKSIPPLPKESIMNDKSNIIILEVALITIGFFSYLSWVNDENPYASCCGLVLCVVFAIFNILVAFYLKWERDEKKKKEKQYQKDFIDYLESQKKEDEK